MKPAQFFLFALTLFLFTLHPLPFTFSPSPSYASTDPSPSTLNPIPSNNLHNYTQQVLLDLSSALTCQLVGIDPSGPDPATGEPKRCLGYDLNGKLGFVSPSTSSGQVGGAIGVMGNLIGVLYTPPASSGDYFRYLANNFGLAKPAYAQGIGFQGLQPLLGVWTAFRNMAYLILVLVFVAIGVLIMLRVKIDPRTVMSIQNQIPKILITLILVTFSYAIAGFLIDMMYVTIYLFINLLVPVSPDIERELSKITSSLQGQTVIGFVNDIPFKGLFGVTGLLGIITAVSGMFGTLLASLFTGTGGTLLDAIFKILGSSLLGGVGAMLAFLIIAIAVLWALFRLWFQLLMAYINILIDVAFAPLWILVGAFPGAGLGFSSWARDLLANLVAFPVTIGMFLLGKIFMESFKNFPNPFVPPLIGNPGDPSVIGALIGLGIILLTPQVVNMVRDAFKAPPFKYTFAIGQALGAGAAVPGAPIKMVASGATWLGGQKIAQKFLPFLKS